MVWAIQAHESMMVSGTFSGTCLVFPITLSARQRQFLVVLAV
jgi:hypothetical protein